MFYYVKITFVLLLINAFFLYRSRRKKKFGIYPGLVTLLMVFVFAGYYAFILSINKVERQPVRVFKNHPSPASEYERVDNLFIADTNAMNARISGHLPALFMIFDTLKIQSLLGFICAVLGLVFINGRNNYYYLIILLYLVLLSVIILLHYTGLDISIRNI